MAESTRRLIYVLNPAAGNGKYLPDARRAASDAHADTVHVTEHAGECSEYIARECLRDPNTHFVVYGGDGTIGEAANGIMMAGAGRHAFLSAVPCGSGNDFIRGIRSCRTDDGVDYMTLDLIRVNGRYVINMLNIGFDCSVVVASEQIRRKRSMPNSLSYILGIGSALVHKTGFFANVRLSDVCSSDGAPLHDEEFSDQYLLTSVGNLPFCGGGFRAMPPADPSDGFMDVMMVRDISIPKFMTLVGAYRNGTHIHAETWNPYPHFRNIVEYRRCRRMEMTDVKQICLDGEVYPAVDVRAEIVPDAIRYIPLP